MANIENGGLAAAVEELETQLDSLNKRMIAVEKKLAHVVFLGEEFWRRDAAILLADSAAKSWRYEVTDPQMPFTDVFQCELFAEGSAKRWVGKSGEIGAVVAINRALPLQFVVKVQSFCSTEVEESFSLRIDDAPMPWASKKNGNWTATIMEAPGRAHLKFSLSIDKAKIPDGKDVSFAFSEISVEPLVTAPSSRPSPPSSPLQS